MKFLSNNCIFWIIKYLVTNNAGWKGMIMTNDKLLLLAKRKAKKKKNEKKNSKVNKIDAL